MTTGIVGGIRATLLCSSSKSSSKTLLKRLGYDQVEIAAALATIRTAAQITCRFRDIENNVEADFGHQQRVLSSEITRESAQALEAWQHTLVLEATAETKRRVSTMQSHVTERQGEVAVFHQESARINDLMNQNSYYKRLDEH